MDSTNVAGLAVICLATGFYAGVALGIYSTNPKTVYVRDLNDDKLPDLIVETGPGTEIVFLQQKDGTYKGLEGLQRELEESIEAKVKQFRMGEIK
jgi:hypothetical protein